MIGIVKNLKDVTSQRKDEEELRKLFSAVEQSPSIVVITDYQGQIEYVNPKFSEITGYKHGEVKGKNPRLLKSGHQSINYYQRLWKTIRSGKEWRGEFYNKKENGELDDTSS